MGKAPGACRRGRVSLRDVHHPSPRVLVGEGRVTFRQVEADMKTEITLDRQTNTAERAAITLDGLIEKANQILDLAIARKAVQ